MLLCAAVVLALGGVQAAAARLARASAPLLALPLLVMLLFYLRGLYRTRLRALVLDGVVPVLSGVSVGAMVVAHARLVRQRPAPPRQSDWVRAWLFALLARRLSGAWCSRSRSAGRARAGWWASRC